MIQSLVIQLAQRERAALVLDKRTRMNKLMYNNAEWMDAMNKLEASDETNYTVVIEYERRIGSVSGYIEKRKRITTIIPLLHIMIWLTWLRYLLMNLD